MDDMTQVMITQAFKALDKAYAPYSNFQVGSCICSEDGSLFTGVNVENSSYSLSVCAETSAICQMVAGGQLKIKSIVVLAGNNDLCTPCGACRQRIYEFSTSDTTIYLCNNQTVLKTMTIDELLPLAFHL